MTKRQVPKWLTAWEYAHRGLHSGAAPENSLAAAEAAIESGLGIECDIQRSRDNVPMVFHDWDLKRLTGIEAATEQWAADAIEKDLRLLGTIQRPLRLRQFLASVNGRVPLLIEVKSLPGYDVDRTCAAVHRELEGYTGKHAVMSFDPRVSVWFAEHSCKTLRGLVMREDEHGYTQAQAERETALEEAQPDFLAYHIAALPNHWVRGLRENGMPILTWTVNDPSARARAFTHTDAQISEGDGLA